MNIEKNLIVGGKRKTAIAKALIKEGSGRIFINNVPYENLDFFRKLIIEEPVEITKKVLGNFNFDINVNVKSGGTESQISSARLAIARAVVEFTESEELKKTFIKYDKNTLSF